MGPRRFREIFVRDVGTTPKNWMASERMEVARHLLGIGTSPLVVSDQLGFSHPNSFRREFKKVHGVSPTKCLEIRWPRFERELGQALDFNTNTC